MHETGRPEEFMSKKLISFCLLSIVFTIVLLFGTPIPPPAGVDGPASPAPPSTNQLQGRYAITTFLGLRGDGKDQGDDSDTEYVNTRTLVYQLLHAPSTKLHKEVPIIVLVNENVRESKRQRLRDDGVIIVEVETISNDRWGDMATRLRIFDPTVVSYEKILFIDADTVLTRPIDKIFNDPSTKLSPVKHHSRNTPDKVDGLPEKFIMAASPVMARDVGSDSARADVPFCNGLFLYSPSRELFSYYQGLLDESELYYTGDKGHDLLNYAHRRGGPMPWQSLHGSWYLDWPGDNDLDGKTPLLHTKWQARDGEVSYSNSAVGKYAQARRWEMEGYWIGKDEAFM
ncbi:glycosyl transferase family 8 protein [Penicillium malachiteum]|uniref:Glycosyl transferase family 8 protein n=1 Tax=Penicillium malachiteum TaxID=1324776 RepID=A0AAD6HPZ5_9EURO|nr:glycosyl transferase family 8 protein [Penicillium malachiteum]